MEKVDREDKKEIICIIQTKLKVELLFGYPSESNLF